MAIDFSDKRVTMAVCPADKRYGFYAFFEVFSKKLRIDTHNQAAMSSLFPDPAAFAKSSVPMSAAQRSSPANCIKAGSNVC